MKSLIIKEFPKIILTIILYCIDRVVTTLLILGIGEGPGGKIVWYILNVLNPGWQISEFFSNVFNAQTLKAKLFENLVTFVAIYIILSGIFWLFFYFLKKYREKASRINTSPL